MSSRIQIFPHPGEGVEISASYIDDFFRPFIEGGGIRSLAEEISNDGQLLSLCASRSYRHVNGFDKIVLEEDGSGRKLTWHRWDNTDPQKHSDYHNHRWNFASFVISGSVSLLDLQEETDGQIEVEKLVYESPGESESFLLRSAGVTSLKQIGERTVHSGDYYFQPYRVVHQARPESPGPSTVILQDAPATLSTDIYRPLGLKEPLKKSAQRFTAEEVRTVLAELLV